MKTPAGAWVVDLLAEPRLAVNGAPAASALLEDGDLVQISGESLRVNYDGSTSTSVSIPPAEAPAPSEPAPAPAFTSTSAPAPPPALLNSVSNGRPAPALHGELVAGPSFRPLVERGEAVEMAQNAHNHAAASPFGEALVMLVRLLRDVHQDHLKLVREELAEIHTLSAKMSAIQTQLTQNPPAASAAESSPEPTRPDPETVRHIVGERLAAWERERESRWRKVLDLLARN